jgi:hypothetical protein
VETAEHGFGKKEVYKRLPRRVITRRQAIDSTKPFYFIPQFPPSYDLSRFSSNTSP